MRGREGNIEGGEGGKEREREREREREGGREREKGEQNMMFYHLNRL